MSTKSDISRAELERLAEDAAKSQFLPVGYFLRLIHRESGFDRHALSPAGAQGIAQFMPGTAVMRGLRDPFDPVEALPKSAELLRDLWSQFGNQGLAAAAYNAGPARVRDWLAGRRALPMETVHYVRAITGKDVAEWAPAGTVRTGFVIGGSFGRARLSQHGWEADLLVQLMRTAPQAASSGVAKGPVTIADGRQPRPRNRVAFERSLCSSCVIQKFY
ncbi:lytic transglycosylase domain-containing protein [Microvirga sp. Mcv34]|uniref:lytic transglycosylase domain-containing protein n=1 Tax=Microvirga sp. Mcv34 TaxID=2926016 RepID=UPI0029057FF5|nr:lytic transglycosylase domain-containing protein [Microvirga sp. Mcv34]